MTIYVRRVPMPPGAKGFIAPDEDGNFSIYINDALSGDALDDAFLHEILHAVREDCYSEKTVREIEEAC